MKFFSAILIPFLVLIICKEDKYDYPNTLIQVNRELKGVDEKLTFILQDNDADCQQGVLEAKADEKKGVIGYYFWGIAIPPIAHTLEAKYGFKIYSKGCMMSVEELKTWSCYNRYMDELIMEKYKEDIIALELTREHKKLQEGLHR